LLLRSADAHAADPFAVKDQLPGPRELPDATPRRRPQQCVAKRTAVDATTTADPHSAEVRPQRREEQAYVAFVDPCHPADDGVIGGARTDEVVDGGQLGVVGGDEEPADRCVAGIALAVRRKAFGQLRIVGRARDVQQVGSGIARTCGDPRADDPRPCIGGPAGVVAIDEYDVEIRSTSLGQVVGRARTDDSRTDHDNPHGPHSGTGRRLGVT
jgi:hypothetical protein